MVMIYLSFLAFHDLDTFEVIMYVVECPSIWVCLMFSDH
jgi:hypothetical protein